MDIFATLFCLSFLWVIYRERRSNRPSQALIPIGPDWIFPAWLLIVFVGFALNRFSADNWQHKLIEFKWVILFYFVTLAMVKFRPNEKWMKSFAIAFGISSLWAIIVWFLRFDPLRQGTPLQTFPNGTVRSGGFLFQPIVFAHLYQIPLCLIVGQLLAAQYFKRKINWILALSAFAGSVAIGLSFTRGVWISLAIAVVAMLSLINRKAALIFLTGVVVLGGLSYQFVPVIKERVNFAFEGGDTERIWIWKANFEMFKDNPFFGVGYGENANLLTEYYHKIHAPEVLINSQAMHAHNQYMQILSGTGLVGLLVYLILIIYFLKLSVKLWRKVPRERQFERGMILGLIGAQIAFWVGGVTEANFEHDKMRYTMIFVWALIIAQAYEFKILVPQKSESFLNWKSWGELHLTRDQFESEFFKVIFGLTGAAVVVFLLSLIFRPIHVDTAILGEPTYWLQKDGVLRSELQRGWFHAEEHFFFTHKLFLYIGSLWIDLVGWGSRLISSLSLIYFLFLITAWYKISRLTKSKDSLSWKYGVLFLLLLISSHHIFELSFVYRPEIGLAACGSWMLYFLLQFLDKEKSYHLLLASLFGALGIGHHLNGVIFVAAGFSLLIYSRKYIPAIALGLIGALGFSFYFLDIRSLPDFNLMVTQLFNMQDIQSEHTHWIHYILNIPKEQSRFLHSPSEISFTLLCFSIIILNFRQLAKSDDKIIVFTGASVLALALISHDKDTKYLALTTPAIVFLTVIGIRNLMQKGIFVGARSWIPKYFIPIALSLFLIGQWRSNLILTFEQVVGTQDYAKLGKDLPPGLKVLGPINAVFWALDNQDQFKSYFVYKILNSHKIFSLSKESLEASVKDDNIEAIILDKEFLKLFKMDQPEVSGFALFNKDPEHGLFLLTKIH